jgi:hypothetical protein
MRLYNLYQVRVHNDYHNDTEDQNTNKYEPEFYMMQEIVKITRVRQFQYYINLVQLGQKSYVFL